jgi:Uma2 family endonuclease
MLAADLLNHDDTPVDDQIVVLRNATWADYQRLLKIRRDRSIPRLAYLEGAIELMSPSNEHELITSLIGRLVEVWCEEREIEFSPVGSWTLENKRTKRAVEPDECYVFHGDPRSAKRPDLAIEVVWTSGGLDKLDIYRRLGVRELWFWKKNQITIHALRGATYAEVTTSRVLPGIDLDQLTSFLDRPTASHAIREYRAALRRRR